MECWVRLYINRSIIHKLVGHEQHEQHEQHEYEEVEILFLLSMAWVRLDGA